MTERLLLHTSNATTGRATSIVIDDETGCPLIISHQNARPIMESAKAIASNFDKHNARKQDFVHVARIPGNIWQELNRLGIARDEKAMNVWLNSREARYFRCDDGRKV
jgi:hypothetical protein